MGILIVVLIIYLVIWVAVRSSKTQNKNTQPHPPVSPGGQGPNPTAWGDQQFSQPHFSAVDSANTQPFAVPYAEQVSGGEGSAFAQPTILGDANSPFDLTAKKPSSVPFHSEAREEHFAMSSHSQKNAGHFAFSSLEGKSAITNPITFGEVSSALHSKTPPSHGAVRKLFRSKQDLRRAIVYHEILSSKFRQ